MVRTRDEIMESIRSRFGDDASDDALQFLEDMTDTLNDYESRTSEDWKSKYEENDKQWRQKYRDRFYSGGEPSPDGGSGVDTLQVTREEIVSDPEPTTFEELFTEE